MTPNVKITFNGRKLEIERGSTIAEALLRVGHPGPFAPVGAIVESRIAGLFRKIRSECRIRTIDRTTKEGMEIYRRTASIVLYAACRRVFPGELVKIGQSIMGGYFFAVDEHAVTAAQARKVEENMRELVGADLPLRPRWIDVDAAARSVRADLLEWKASLLDQQRSEDAAALDLDGATYQLFGAVGMSTGAIECFAVSAYQGGLVLHFPRFTGKKPVVGKAQPKLFATFRETAAWNAVVGCESVAQLNQRCMSGSISRLVKVAEAQHERKIVAIADEIIGRHPDLRLVLIAGPSASGKTTFSKRLEVQLQVGGLKPVTLSVDNYYVDRVKTPKHADGTYNFEAVEAIDLDLLHDHVRRLVKGEEVRTPVFSFETGRRLKNHTVPIRLSDRGVLIMEGIHSLNERLSTGIARKRKYKIFVSALTQLAIDEHNRIFTSDARLIRRITRDRLYRGYTAQQTIEGWASVRAGEEEHIFPFQEEADVRFNSALVYEQAVLKPYAERFLMEVARHSDAFIEATRLHQFLQFFIPILPEEVPPTSVLREFIGGSTFHY